MINAVEKAKKLAVAVKSENFEQEQKEWEQAINRARELSGDLFEIERLSKEAIDKEINELGRFLANSQRDEKYHRLSLEPLTWRTESGLPKLAIFSLGSPLCSFEVSLVVKNGPRSWSNYREGVDYYYQQKMIGDFPKAISDKYQDVIEYLLKEFRTWFKTDFHYFKAQTGTKFSLSFQFNGVIPDETRQKIKAARQYFGSIYIIAEAKEWALNREIIMPVGKDPLVVGYADGKLWLIDDFATTPVEDAMFLHQ